MGRMRHAWLLLLVGSLGYAENWPAFRGADPGRQAPNTKGPTLWNEKTNVEWVVNAGAGWSSPIVWGDRVFLTSAISDEKQPEPRKGLYVADLQGKSPKGEHRWMVHCYAARTGKELWNRTAFSGKASSTVHIKNSLASETPVTDGKRVIAHFGNVGLVCFDMDGELLWKETLRPVKTRMGWGTGASPALHDGKLFLVNDNEEKSDVRALDAQTGKQLWRTSRDEKSNWATPYIWKHADRTELVTAGSGAIRSYDLEGRELWRIKGMSVLAIPTPFAADGLLYVTSGYILDPIIKPIYVIKPGAKGDISLKAKESSNDAIVWSQRLAGPYHPTPVAYEGHLYVLYDKGTLSCFDAKTGEEVYSKKRLPGASAFTASPWAYDGKVFCMSEDGETFVVQAGKEFKILHRNPLNEMALATPALAGGSLLVRTQSKLYCLRAK